MKKIVSLCLSLVMVVALSIPAFAVEIKSFSDVASNRWSYKNIMLCVQHGAIAGTKTPDANGVGEFNPTGTVTVGQFIVSA